MIYIIILQKETIFGLNEKEWIDWQQWLQNFAEIVPSEGIVLH